jgi:glycosyltransferase involved in cell wall biosynthesis
MEKLVVGYDAKRAVNNMTGLGNYSRLVVDVMSSTYPQNEHLLYSSKPNNNERLAPLLLRDNVKLRLAEPGFINKNLHFLWRSFSISSQLEYEKIDIFHGLSNELPLNIQHKNIPSVVTIHDIIYRRMPKCYKPIDRILYDYKYKKSCQNATRIIAISECTKRDIVNDYNINPDKIDIIYQGCHGQFLMPQSPEKLIEVKKKYSLPERFFVGVGTIEERKNQLLSLMALRDLPREISLVLVGRRTDYAAILDRFIAKYNLQSRVKFIENVAFSDLPAIYKLAIFSSYPSRYEGFGLPVIESISTGTPVIAATGSCLEEAGGKGAVYVNPDDAEAFIFYAKKLIEDSDFGAQLRAFGSEYIKRFTVSSFAQNMMNTYIKTIQTNS